MIQPDPRLCEHGRSYNDECLPCAVLDAQAAYDAAVRQVQRTGDRLRALRALQANLEGVT